MLLAWHSHITELGLPIDACQERMDTFVSLLSHLLKRDYVDKVVPLANGQLLDQLHQFPLVGLAPRTLVVQLLL